MSGVREVDVFDLCEAASENERTFIIKIYFPVFMSTECDTEFDFNNLTSKINIIGRQQGVSTKYPSMNDFDVQ